MKNKWIYIIAALAVVIIAGVIVFAVNYDIGSSSYVAKVGNEKITVVEYNYFLNSLKMQWEQSAVPPDPTTGVSDPTKVKAFWKTPIEGKNAVDALKDKALEGAKGYKIELIKAKESKIVLEKKELDDIDAYMNNIITQMGTKEAAETRVKELFNINLDQFKAIYTGFKITEKFRNQKIAEGQPKAEEITKYITDNKKEVERASVRHILFLNVDSANKPLAKDKIAAAKKKADDMLVKVKAGGDVKTLAEANSEDTEVKTNGGLYMFDGNGSYTDVSGQVGTLVPEFTAWAFDAKRKVGDSGIVATTYGYHVVKLEKYSTLDEEKANAKTGINTKAYTTELDAWNKDAKYNATRNTKVYNPITVNVG